MFLLKSLTRFAVAAAMLSSVARRAAALATQEVDGLPRPPGVHIGSLPREAGHVPFETSVAVNPRDPQQVVVAYFGVGPPHAKVGVRRFDARVAWSADGGKSWTVAAGTAPENYLVSGDPSVTIDFHGHAFLAYSALDRVGQGPYWGKGASRNGMFVRRSLDGGRTWEASHAALIEYPTMRDPPLQDRGYVVADNQTASPYAGNLYAGWTRFSLDKSEILFARSTDDGATWSRPIVISTEPGVPRGAPTSGAVVGFHAAVGRDGTVYAIWSDGQAIVLAISRDGGRTFEPSRRVVPTTSWVVGASNFPGAYGFPSIGIDARSSPGKLFVAWGDYRNGDIDIFLATSDDGGRTWAPPVRVNDDAKHNGKDQVLPWLAVDPTDGAAYVMFYDRRGDPKNLQPTVTLARSIDGGHTFTNYAWSVTPSDPKQAHLGDYNGVAAMNGRVYGAWPDNVPNSQKPKTQPLMIGPAVIRIGIADFRTPGPASGANVERQK